MYSLCLEVNRNIHSSEATLEKLKNLKESLSGIECLCSPGHNSVCVHDFSSTFSVEGLSDIPVFMIQRSKSESSAPFLLALNIFKGFLLIVIKFKNYYSKY